MWPKWLLPNLATKMVELPIGAGFFDLQAKVWLWLPFWLPIGDALKDLHFVLTFKPKYGCEECLLG